MRINDSSDTWSLMVMDEAPTKAMPRKVRANVSHMTIVGIRIDTSMQDVERLLGPTAEVERGDAANGRTQICYTPPDRSEYLVFEVGEVASAFYVLDGSKKWNGSEFCKVSEKLGRRIATRSGIMLNMSAEAVRHILGIPSERRPGRWVYSFQTRVKSSAESLKKLRAENPQMSDTEFKENYEYFDYTAYIVASFRNSKLVAYAALQGETN